VITPDIKDDPTLVALKPGTEAVPEIPAPVAALEFVQLYVAEVTFPEKATAGTASPLQYVELVTALTVGTGFTTIV
jgi:hypothetical protein